MVEEASYLEIMCKSQDMITMLGNGNYAWSTEKMIFKEMGS